MTKLMYLVFLLLAGCAQRVIYPPAMPKIIPPPPKVNGTIYQPGYTMGLYNDKTAGKIGDVLTVRLEESTRGEYRSKTRTNKTAQLNYPIPTWFGNEVSDLEIQTNTQQQFDSRGDSDESDRLTGIISVTVIDKLSNGNLVVAGENWVTINRGRKFMRLKGIVRQIDIRRDNSISSQKIADAEISYSAGGQAGNATGGGLITRLFNAFALY